MTDQILKASSAVGIRSTLVGVATNMLLAAVKALYPKLPIVEKVK